MPTKFDRIAVTKDPELIAALERVAPLVPDAKTATLVRDLAIRGAQALLADQERKQAALERLIERSTSPEPGFDRAVLARVDEEAWGAAE